ncbi:TPA: hypothetical protein HMM23_02500 [Escherichia coli]|nr:hypothetical protein [Escherichia coli]HAJ2086462.1 hypothetical protein [Escherichia coli]HAJ2269271.1 hypothetical protein [Escherichia coli]HAJ2274579.1 hypothetical protein [Escherichia coli]
MENNNRLMPHIRRTTHIMKFAHRNSFDFAPQRTGLPDFKHYRLIPVSLGAHILLTLLNSK